MIRKDHCVSNDNVFSPTGGKDDDFSDVIRRERLAARINSICLGFITVESNNGKFRFDLARIDFDNPDPCCDELLPQSVGEASNSSFSGTINAASRVRLSSRYASNVDDPLDHPDLSS